MFNHRRRCTSRSRSSLYLQTFKGFFFNMFSGYMREVKILKVIYEKNKRKAHKGNNKDRNFVDFVFAFEQDC